MRISSTSCRYLHVHQRGFSLLEVLVAFTIASIALGVLFQIYGSGARAGNLSQQYARATLLAESIMAETETTTPLLSGTEEGVALADYRWVRNIQPFESTGETAEPDGGRLSHRNFALLEVTVEVGWNGAGKERSVKLKSLRIGSLE